MGIASALCDSLEFESLLTHTPTREPRDFRAYHSVFPHIRFEE